MTTKTTQTERRGSDVSERMMEHTSNCILIGASLPEDRAGAHLAEHLLKTSTEAYLHHAAAEGSPSAKEFAEKFRDALKALRMNRRILLLLEKTAIPCNGQAVRSGLEEVDILIRIFFSSIRTLENKAAA